MGDMQIEGGGLFGGGLPLYIQPRALNSEVVETRIPALNPYQVSILGPKYRPGEIKQSRRTLDRDGRLVKSGTFPQWQNQIVEKLGLAVATIPGGAMRGPLFTMDGRSIDSKRARFELQGMEWYKRPTSALHFQQKAMIRFAQSWNRLVRKTAGVLNAMNLSADDVSKRIIQRQERARPEARAKAALLRLIKGSAKYGDGDINSRLAAKDRLLAAFQERQQIQAATTRRMVESGLGPVLPGDVQQQMNAE